MPRSSTFAPALAVGALTFLAACIDQPTELVEGPQFAVVGQSELAASMAALMDDINVALASEGVGYQAAMVEYVTNGDGDEMGQTVLARNVGNKHLGADFVPNDPRRAWSGPIGGETDDVTYAIDTTGDAAPVRGGVGAAAADAAIVRSMNTWDALQCSDIALNRAPDFGEDIGLVAFFNGLGGSPFVFADVQHAGWRDIDFAGGVLGATFTFVFINGDGAPTDVDNNGLADTAFREIYYDPSWRWADDGSSDVDIESVATHEAGHGLSQGHFGTVSIKVDGSLMASPRAVMNALYSAPYRDLAGTDEGGHCSNWSSWPYTSAGK